MKIETRLLKGEARTRVAALLERSRMLALQGRRAMSDFARDTAFHALSEALRGDGGSVESLPERRAA